MSALIPLPRAGGGEGAIRVALALRGLPITAARRRHDRESLAGLEHRMGRARQLFDAAVIAANKVAAVFPLLAALQAEGPDAAVAGKDREVQPLARADRPLCTVARRPLAAPAEPLRMWKSSSTTGKRVSRISGRSGANWSCACEPHRLRHSRGRPARRSRSSRNTGSRRCRKSGCSLFPARRPAPRPRRRGSW